jgi:hypothetical protein
VVDPRPLSYEPPEFPSLYWPFPVSGTQTVYLYDASTIFRFILLWTLIDVIGIHLIAAIYAMLIQWRNWKMIWITPIVFGVVGGIEALIAGSVVGGVYVGKPFFVFLESLELIRLLQYRRCLHRRLLWHVDMDTLLVGDHQRSCPDLVFLCDPRRLVNGPRRDGGPRFAGIAGLVVDYRSVASRNKQNRTFSNSRSPPTGPMSWIKVQSKHTENSNLPDWISRKEMNGAFQQNHTNAKLELRYIALGIILQDQELRK